MQRLISVKEFAEQTGLPKGRAYELVRIKDSEIQLPVVKIGRRYFIVADEMEAYLKDSEKRNKLNAFFAERV